MECKASEALRVSGLTYKQLDHVIRCGLLTPERASATGRGHPRRFGVMDLLALTLVHELLRSGMPLRAMSHALRLVPRGRDGLLPEQLGEAFIWTDGRAAKLVRRSALSDAPSRPVFWILDLGAAAAQVRGRLRGTPRAAA